MISYDSYQNRIKRIAAIKNFIVRFRLLFIALAVLLVATVITLLSIMGIVTQDIILPENPVYGDTFTVKAPKAIMSNAEYQFRYLGKAQSADADKKASVRASLTSEEQTATQEGEWTDEVPSLAGRYEVRVVTKSGFGGKKYSSPKQFEVKSKPVEFLITAESLTYGTAPASGNYEFALANGDRLITEGLIFDYDDPSQDITDICAKADSFVILNSAGVDVTFCYDISTPKKAVTLEEKSITLSLEDTSCEYIGAPVEYTPALTQSTLSALKGDITEFTTVITDSNGTVVEAPVNAGEYTVTIQSGVMFFNGDKDVTSHYKIERALTATLTVQPRKISIKTATDSKEYDGAPLVNATVDQSGLIDGHKLSALALTSDMKDVGEYENAATYAIFDADGNNVTDNYDIDCTYGTLTISKREITVKTADHTKIYDGTALSERDYKDYTVTKDGSDALAKGHTQVLGEYSLIIDAGSEPNLIDIDIYDEDGNFVTNNYNIDYQFGTLTVSKREITVTTPTDSWRYDGYDHSNTDIEIKLSDGTDGNPIADGEEFKINENASVTYYSEEAVTNTVIGSIFRNFPYTEVTENYKITYEFGTLSITKRPVTITTPTQSRPYDGTVMSGNEGEIFADGLADNDIIYANAATDIVELKYVDKKENTTHFKIHRAYSSQFSPVETTNSYDITYIYGELEITKRDITIHTSSPFKDYDGTPLRGDRDIPKIDNLAEGDSYEAYDVAERTVVGDTVNTTQYLIVYSPAQPLPDSDYDEVIFRPSAYSDPQPNPDYYRTDNYNITYDYGTITVNKRPVIITTATSSKEYDGEAYSDTQATSFNLVVGHTLKVNPDFVYATVTDVSEGDVENKVEYLIFDGDDDVTENYKIDPDYGTIKRTCRIVQVKTVSDSWVYDGQQHSNSEVVSILHGKEIDNEFISDDETPLVKDHFLKEASAQAITNVGKVSNNCTYYVYDKQGNNVSKNYELLIDPGELEITKRPLEITTHDGNRVYDDTPFSYIHATAEEFNEENERGIVAGHEIVHNTSRTTALVTYVTEGKVKNEHYYFVYNGGENVTENYSISYENGDIWVTARPITIQTKTSSTEFDGEAYSDADTNPDNVITSGSLADGHCLSVVAKTSVVFVTEGEVDNIVSYAIKRGNDDLTLNYAVTYAPYGKISRTKRPVNVLTATHVWTYDGDEHFDYGYTAKHIVDGEVTGQDGLVLEHKLKVEEGYATVIIYSETATENICSYTVVTKDGTDDMSGNYTLTYKYGSLSVEKRRIIITTPTKTHYYDGDPFCWTEGWSVKGELDVDGNPLETGLVKEHTLKVKAINTYVTDVQFDKEGNVIGVENDVEYEVYDGETSVDFNYDIIEYKKGTITINQRLISIETDSANKVYDGTPLYCTTFTYDKFGDSTFDYNGLLTNKNHSVELDESVNLEYLSYLYVNAEGKRGDVKRVDLTESKSFASITYITKIDGKLINSVFNMRSYKIIDKNNENADVSKNYRFIMTYGVLTILERPLNITTPTISKPYDGTYLYGDSKEPVFDNLVKIDDVTESYTVVADTVPSIIDVRESGKINTTEYEIWSVDGKQNTTLCYDITRTEDAALYITRIPLSITTISADKVYDGTPLKGDDISYGNPVFVGLVDSEEYCISTNVASITNFGSESNTTEYIIRAYRNGTLTDITDNYGDGNESFITYDPGTLTINKRTVKIHVIDAEHEYDGSKFTSTEWEEDEDTPYSLLVEEKFGHTLEVVAINADITNVGTKPNEVTYKVVDKDGDDKVNGNYKLEYRYGTLTVFPRNIKIITPDGEWTYDAEEHFNDAADCKHLKDGKIDETQVGLVLDHTLKTVDKTIITEYGTKLNVCSYIIVSGGDDVSANYALNESAYEYGTLTINKRPVTITTTTKTHEYDGNAFSYTDDAVVEEFDEENESGIVSTHVASLDPAAEIPSVKYVHEGAVENALKFIIKDKDGKLVTHNYELEENYDYGTISITPHTITVTNATVSKPYDGTYLYGYDNDHKPEVIGLIENDNISPDNVSEIIDVGSIENATTYTITAADGTLIYDGAGGVDDSYIIEYTEGTTLSVTIVSLRITTATLEKVYDGTALYGDNSKNGNETEEISPFVIEYYDPEADSWIEGVIEGEWEADKNSISAQLDFGSCENQTEYLIFAERGGKLENITANYGEITYNYGTLTVNARKIIITTDGGSREFNGKPFTVETATVTTGDPAKNYVLVSGHKLKVKEGFTVPSVTYVTDGENGDGKVQNIIEYDIVDENDDSVYGNYEIVKTFYGEISITKKPIDVTTESVTLEYNGKPQGSNKISPNLKEEGYSFDITEPFAITNVSENSENNNVVKYRIIDADGVDRTVNYDLTDHYGTVTIKPLTIHIELNKIDDLVYGDTFIGYQSVDGKMYNYAVGSPTAVDGETLEITVGYKLSGTEIAVPNPTNADDYDVVLANKSIVGGNADIDNYEVIYTSSSFTISPKPITITLLEPENGGKMYDGVGYAFPTSEGYGYELVESTLAYDDVLTIAVIYLQNGTFSDNILIPLSEKAITGYPTNAASYVIQFNAVNCTLSGDKPISNYEISCEISRQSYIITQRPIYFDVAEVTLTYTSLGSYSVPDEAALPDFDETLLADGDSLTNVESSVSNLDGSYISSLTVGKYKSYVNSFEVMRDGKRVTANYYLDNSDSTKNNAKFEIVERRIELSVIFPDTNTSVSSNEYTGKEINLNTLYDSAPYASRALNSHDEETFGIGANDVNYVEAVFSFKQNGVEVPLIERGTYEVYVTLVDKEGYDVLKNYEIVGECVTGEFTVTRRQVIVTPKTTQTNIEYNGKPIDQTFFDYDTQHKFVPSDAGFISNDDKAAFNAEYSLYKKGDESNDLINDILIAGTYTLKINLTYKDEISDEEKKYDIDKYNPSLDIVVSPRTVYVATYDDNGDYVYDKTAHGNVAEYGYIPYIYENGVWKTDGVFCNEDAEFATPQFSFELEKISYEEAVNAGTYSIKVDKFTGINAGTQVDLSSNYKIIDFSKEEGERTYGRITVRQAKVLLKPLPYYEEYKGVNTLKMPENNYSIEYVEGNDNKKLFGTDKLSVTFSGVAKISSGSVNVKISEVKVIYSEGNKNGIENYLICYTYSQLKKNLPEMVESYSYGDFMANLAFTRIKLTVSQVTPPESQIEYGNYAKIKNSDVAGLQSGCTGLLDGHKVSLMSNIALPANKLGTIKNWLTAGSIKITDAGGVNVTNGYEIEVLYEGAGYEATYIEVVARNVEVNVNFAPSEIAEGTVLGSGTYKINKGSFYSGDKLTVTVKDGKFVASVKDYAGENDKTDYYNVTFNYQEPINELKEEADVSRI